MELKQEASVKEPNLPTPGSLAATPAFIMQRRRRPHVAEVDAVATSMRMALRPIDSHMEA